jgi:hypothetical protein
LSSCSRPSRKTTFFGDAYGIDTAGNPCGSAWRYGSARSMKLFQISAGYVPPATGSPWYSVSIGRNRLG